MTLACTSPARRRRPTLLIVGCGDVGMRVAKLLRGRWRLLALTTSAKRCAELRAAGIVPLLGDLDLPASLQRAAGLADAVLHLAPPPLQGRSDPRTTNLLQALARRGGVGRIVYGSTSGVYGDCGGAFVDETRAVAPATDRAHRASTRPGACRWRASRKARRRCWNRTTSTPTTSTPTTWRTSSRWPCFARCRDGSTTRWTTAP